MILWVAKFGITISLFMVAHALFYPNKFSLIIAILGYIIALVSAVIYGLCRSSKTLQESTAVSIPESPIKSFLKNTIDSSPRMSTLPLQKSNIGPIIQALGNEKGIDEVIFKISAAEELDELDIFRESSWIRRNEDDKYTEDDIPGYQ